MFDVRSKENHKLIKHVFSIRTTESRHIQFLTFDFGKWFWLPLEDYQPIDFPLEAIN